MKKAILFGVMLMLAGCSNLNGMGANSTSVQGKMQSCLMAQAQSRLNAGTLFTKSVTATAKELVGTCMQRLALQSAGISDEAQNTAENIITSLKGLQGLNLQ